MTSPTITNWIAFEKSAFDNFNEFVAGRLEDAIFRSLTEYMRLKLKDQNSVSVTLPWGTYSAEVKTVGETTNITPVWEPSKNFLKLLNDDSGVNSDRRQDTFDPEYMRLFKTYAAAGNFGVEIKGAPAKEKGMKLSDDEADWFLNDYMQVMANIARDKQREGKIYRLEIDEVYPHGSFDFEYTDDEIKVTFVPNKVFKQALKDDEVAAAAATTNFAWDKHATMMDIAATAASVSKKSKHEKPMSERIKFGKLRIERDVDGCLIIR